MNSVYQWREAWQQGGDAALVPKPVPGRPPKLTNQQRQRLLEVLLQGARAYGFPNELWTLKRIAAVLQVACRLRDHPSHVWKVLRRLDGSGQVPERRAVQRDEQAIAHGTRDKWPAIKQSLQAGSASRLP